MKKTLFWVLFIPLGLMVVIAGILHGICEWIYAKANQFEDWCVWK